MEGITHTLTKEELADYKANGLISNNIESLSSKIKGWSVTYDYPTVFAFLKTIGVKESFIPTSFQTDSFFLTDFVLICCEGWEDYKNYNYSNSDPVLSFVPLEYVEECEVRIESYTKYSQGYTKIQKTSPVKGAIIGGVIGGSTGAVIGATAAANSSGKEVYVPPEKNRYRNITMAIKIKGETLHEYKFPCSLPDDMLSQKNLHTRELIRTASTALDMESKKRLLSEVNAAQKKASLKNIIKWVILIIASILIFYAYSRTII